MSFGKNIFKTRSIIWGVYFYQILLIPCNQPFVMANVVSDDDYYINFGL